MAVSKASSSDVRNPDDSQVRSVMIPRERIIQWTWLPIIIQLATLLEMRNEGYATVEASRNCRALQDPARKGILHTIAAGRLIGLSRKCICQIESGSVMPHCRTWNRFADLEERHNRPQLEMPTHWD